ncbi:MAG: ImmA/IrrE family metallo-endopeptidase [Methanobrevibacter sp.]|nr:ImmA/IrrE family metallo-endopeptidase [Methanobrevibacter sp.]
MINKSIKLNKIKWDIKEVPENDNALDGNRGYCYYRTSTIYILETLKPTEKVFTLFHELTHAALHETDYNEEIRQGLGDNYEKFVSLLGARIWEICEQVNNNA